MKAHGITDPENLTEFDQWVNDATRVDIENIVKGHNAEVFGIHTWKPWKKTKGKNLIGTCNFSVDYIFKNTDEQAVDKIIAKYEEKAKGKEWNKELSKLSWKTVTALNNLALDSCLWV